MAVLGHDATTSRDEYGIPIREVRRPTADACRLLDRRGDRVRSVRRMSSEGGEARRRRSGGRRGVPRLATGSSPGSATGGRRSRW
jgi:hypothetical protein